MNIKELIECYIDHRREVVTRRTQVPPPPGRGRAHILEGCIIALDNLDDFVKIIRASANRRGQGALMAKYPLSEIQTNAILEGSASTGSPDRARQDRGGIHRADEAHRGISGLEAKLLA